MPTPNFRTEWPIIQRIAASYAVDPMFIAAIRVAENGGPGREFGVLSESAPTYEDQCRGACASVRGHLFFPKTNPFVLAEGPAAKRLVYSPAWIEAFSRSWAPPDVPNDPTDLNQNWLKDATTAYDRFVKTGIVI